MACCFEPKACVRTRYNDSLVVEGGMRDRGCDEELGVDEREEVGEGHGEDILILLLLREGDGDG